MPAVTPTRGATRFPTKPRLLALTAFVATQSRGLPIAPPDDPRLAPALAEGRALFEARQGQLGLSCAICQMTRIGVRRLGSAVIPQGHPTGYPLYRLEWQGLGSLPAALAQLPHRHTAEPFKYGAPEYVALEHLPRDPRRPRCRWRRRRSVPDCSRREWAPAGTSGGRTPAAPRVGLLRHARAGTLMARRHDADARIPDRVILRLMSAAGARPLPEAD